ncbi:hypothetical protein BD410DRAFT_292281 [Rickenella mellea]|uniref:Zn(2)-C6 fungal-type domain-containing protein n=1 Tax=Rickenella mellea TaxID=50990 RepID=A0A4Y7Q2E4_9AGAM|nr:hypothetical protein BD410DRAFT_292281 [Rickenella mellea]
MTIFQTFSLVVSILVDRYPVDTRTSSPRQDDTISLRDNLGAPQNTQSLDIYLHDASEDRDALTELPIFRPRVESGKIAQLESCTPRHDHVEAELPPHSIETLEYIPMSTAYTLSLLQYRRKQVVTLLTLHRDRRTEGVHEIANRRFRRSLSGITEEDGSVYIPYIPLGSPFPVLSDQFDMFQSHSSSIGIHRSYAYSKNRRPCSRCRLLKVRCDFWQRDGSSSSGCSRCERANFRCDLFSV